MANLLFNTEQFKTIYNTISLHKSKDKIDMVLEPLQSMIQIALLSVSPIGTKMTIQENILYLQTPCLTQPLSRWYYSDKKDDLYFLFQVIKRFLKWYNPSISSKSPLTKELFSLIIQMSIKGLDNLIKTYNKTENNNIIQVINMYKNMLEYSSTIDYTKHLDDKVDVDVVFENIISTYNTNILSIIYNTLLIIEKEDDYSVISNYIQGMNMIMIKHNTVIKTWIKVNLVF